MTEVFRQIDNVTAARQIRLHLATDWIALVVGPLLTVSFTLFFGS